MSAMCWVSDLKVYACAPEIRQVARPSSRKTHTNNKLFILNDPSVHNNFKQPCVRLCIKDANQTKCQKSRIGNVPVFELEACTRRRRRLTVSGRVQWYVWPLMHLTVETEAFGTKCLDPESSGTSSRALLCLLALRLLKRFGNQIVLWMSITSIARYGNLGSLLGCPSFLPALSAWKQPDLHSQNQCSLIIYCKSSCLLSSAPLPLHVVSSAYLHGFIRCGRSECNRKLDWDSGTLSKPSECQRAMSCSLSVS